MNEAEREAWNKLSRELLSVGAVNSNERAAAHRRALLSNASAESRKRMLALFAELNLAH